MKSKCTNFKSTAVYDAKPFDPKDDDRRCGAEFEQTDGLPVFCPECIAQIEADRQREHEEWIAKMRATHERQRALNLGVEVKYADEKVKLRTFWSEEKNEQRKRERGVIKNLERWIAEDTAIKKGIFIFGEPGLGKSHLTQAALVAAWKRTHEAARFVAFEDILRAVRSTFDNEDGPRDIDVINEFATYGKDEVGKVFGTKWLVIDDLGASEKASDFSLRVMYEVINKRLKYGLPTLLTSNYTLDLLIERIQPKDREGKRVGDDIEAARIVDRITEMCDVYELAGESYRK